eukprot:4463479-Prymnesium_polylepis.1
MAKPLINAKKFLRLRSAASGGACGGPPTPDPTPPLGHTSPSVSAARAGPRAVVADTGSGPLQRKQ